MLSFDLPDLCETVPALQRTNTGNLKQIFPEKELCGHSPNFYICVPVSNLYISHDQSAYSAAGNMWTDPRIYKSLTDT
jgi:hypothetical protein